MCSVEDGSMHLKDCSNCGVSSIQFSNPELSKADDVPDLKWKIFEYIDIKTKHGTNKKLTLVDKTTKPGEMIDNLTKVL